MTRMPLITKKQNTRLSWGQKLPKWIPIILQVTANYFYYETNRQTQYNILFEIRILKHTQIWVIRVFIENNLAKAKEVQIQIIIIQWLIKILVEPGHSVNEMIYWVSNQSQHYNNVCLHRPRAHHAMIIKYFNIHNHSRILNKSRILI